MITLSIVAASPELAACLRADPALVPGAVEETLRFEPPVPAVYRETVDEAQITIHVEPENKAKHSGIVVV